LVPLTLQAGDLGQSPIAHGLKLGEVVFPCCLSIDDLCPMLMAQCLQLALVLLLLLSEACLGRFELCKHHDACSFSLGLTSLCLNKLGSHDGQLIRQH
jgi:hypothetical protein